MADQQERERIIDVATNRFLETGISKVTLDEIAAELRMSKKTVYKFFPSKDDLLKAMAKTMMWHMEHKVQAIVESQDSFEHKMTRLLVLVGGLTRRLSKQFQIDMQRFAPELWKEIETFRRERIFSKVRQMFIQAKQEGSFREDLNLDLFFLVFLNAAQGIMNPQTLSQQSFSAEEAFRGIFKLLFEGALTIEAREKFHFFDSTFSEHS